MAARRKVKPKATKTKTTARRKVGATEEAETKLPGHGEEEPTRTWVLRLLLYSNAYLRLSSYSDELASVLSTIGMKQSGGDKPEPAAVAKHVRAELARATPGPESDEAKLLRRNVALLGELVGLDEAEREIVRFTALSLHRGALRACVRSFERMTPRGFGAMLGRVLGVPEAQAARALDPRRPLRRLGLIRLDRSVYVDESPLLLLEHLDEQLFELHDDVASLIGGFAQLSRPARLGVEDYPHLTREITLLERLLRAASEQKQVGVNVLLHGASGTGKTELTRVLAARLGIPLHDVRVEGGDDKVLGGYERLTAYQLCQRLADHSRPALVLFDEVEDVFRSPAHELFDEQASAGHDKGYMTRLLEDNPVPALWVCNRIDTMDPAILRRFDLVLEVPTPPERVRRAVLDRYLEGLAVRPDWLELTATDEALTPAHVERAARVLRLVAPTTADDTTDSLDRVLRNSLAVTRTTAAPSRRQMALSYDLSLVRTDTPLEPLVTTLERTPSGSLCLAGPPGTGKTAFVAYLARRLQRPLLLRRASELLGPYVGQTEANLAEAFRRAQRDGAVLFLDEVDSFLQNREGADRQWEVTQVNELLTQMDTFDGVFVCATNRLDHLDPSSLRRFDVRVRFLYLDPAQRRSLAARALAELTGQPEAPLSSRGQATLDHLTNLTPGDFAVVVRRSRLLGRLADEASLLVALEAEARSKTDGSKPPVGFAGG